MMSGQFNKEKKLQKFIVTAKGKSMPRKSGLVHKDEGLVFEIIPHLRWFKTNVVSSWEEFTKQVNFSKYSQRVCVKSLKHCS